MKKRTIGYILLGLCYLSVFAWLMVFYGWAETLRAFLFITLTFGLAFAGLYLIEQK